MKYIKSFTEFLNESDSLDYDKVASVFSILSKYYESDKPFYTDALNFVLQEEIRNWAIIRDEVELEKTKSEDCFYKLIFDLSEKQYLLEIKFKIYYKGIKEKDVPETASQLNIDRLNCILEDYQIKHIVLKSPITNFETTHLSHSIKRSVNDFMLRMLKDDYDTLGKKMYDLEQM